MALTSALGTGLLQGAADFGAGFLLVWLLVVVLVIAGAWKVFEKAGEPGWHAIIPIWNIYVMTKIGGVEWWWLLVLMFVPIVNLYAMYKIYRGVAEAFGQGLGFTLGLWFLPFIFWPLLGFGDYPHQGTPA